MRIVFGRSLWARCSASAALLAHLFLVGSLAGGEAFHAHEHGSDLEWHSDGSHQHGDEVVNECPLCLSHTSVGLATLLPPSTHEAQTRSVAGLEDHSVPIQASPRSAATARGPPLA